MTKIISVNAGSSSLKFQLFEMPEETVLTSGIVEKIGFEDAIFTTVSYTHLVMLNFGNERVAIDFNRIPPRTAPVSYTHLDVYKRQV